MDYGTKWTAKSTLVAAAVTQITAKWYADIRFMGWVKHDYRRSWIC